MAKKPTEEPITQDQIAFDNSGVDSFVEAAKDSAQFPQGEELQDVIDGVVDQKPSADAAFESLEAEMQQSPDTQVTRIDGAQTIVELSDHIEIALNFQEGEIERTTTLLHAIDDRLGQYDRMQEQLDKLKANGQAKRKEVMSALEAATFSKAMLETRRIK